MYTRKQCTMSGVSTGQLQKVTCVSSIAMLAALHITMPRCEWLETGNEQSRCAHMVYLQRTVINQFRGSSWHQLNRNDHDMRVHGLWQYHADAPVMPMPPSSSQVFSKGTFCRSLLCQPACWMFYQACQLSACCCCV